MTVIEEIATERQRQIESEGFTLEHDDEHTDGSLAKAAASYALAGGLPLCDRHNLEWISPAIWPRSWSADKWWKPKDSRRDLIRAGALIVAEIERLDRMEERK